MSSNTASASRTIVFAPKGTAGSRGPALRGPREWSTLADGAQLYAGAEGDPFIDVVIHNGYYYYCKTTHAKNGIYSEPGRKYSDSFWQLGDSLDLVATQVLLSKYAVIKNLGAEAIEMKDADGNVVFEAKDGNVTCQTGTFNNVNVQTGQVAGFSIEGNGLINTGFDNDAYIIIRHDEQKAFAGIGGNVLSAVMGARAVAKFTNLYDKDTSTTATNYGAIIAAQGARTNVAMLIDGGCVQGYAMSNLVISAASNVTRTLNRAQNNVLAIGSAIASVYLPAMELHDDGHVIRFKSLIPSPGGIRIYTSACKTYNGTATRTSKPVIIYGRGEYITGTNYLPVENVGDAMELVWVRDVVTTLNGTTYYGAWVQYKFPRDW